MTITFGTWTLPVLPRHVHELLTSQVAQWRVPVERRGGGHLYTPSWLDQVLKASDCTNQPAQDTDPRTPSLHLPACCSNFTASVVITMGLQPPTIQWVSAAVVRWFTSDPGRSGLRLSSCVGSLSVPAADFPETPWA